MEWIVRIVPSLKTKCQQDRDERKSNANKVVVHSMTKYDLVISVLSMFILLLKATLVPMHVFYPIFSFVIHGLEIGLWGYSLYGQTSSDTLDPKGRRNAPWYITKSCNVAYNKSNVGYCEQAKASFYVSIIMLCVSSSP
jgi:hypothetical protein